MRGSHDRRSLIINPGPDILSGPIKDHNMLTKIYNAKAKRSGSAVTIKGIDTGGAMIKVVDVSEIDFTGVPTIATTKDGTRYALINGAGS